MCQYCNYRYRGGWTQLLEHDEVYQTAISDESGSTYGFCESWGELRGGVDLGVVY